jgi:ElaB/YqjD/DUF883 family membrane-anchored ribosome-binding protein
MAVEPASTQNAEGRPKYQDPPSSAFGSAHLPGTPPAVDEAKGMQMHRERQLREIAERIGGVMGFAVRSARDVSGRVRGGIHLVEERARQRADSASQSVSGWADLLGEKYRGLRAEADQTAWQIKENASERISGWNGMARQKFSEIRERGARLKDEHPLQILAGIAATGFVIGLALRLRRSNRGY